MLYLFLDKNSIKLIFLKRTILGQQETSFFEKIYETNFIEDGKVLNVDLLASAMKEVLTSASEKTISDNSVFLVLPQESFYFMRSQVPDDIAPTALNSFIADKARSSFPVSPDDCFTTTFIRNGNSEKTINFFGIAKDTFESFQKAFSLIDLKISALIPETLSYFKLFEKTLRNEKKENILYITLKNDSIYGYLYDSFGLLNDKKIEFTIKDLKDAEAAIKEKVEELSSNGTKLNRIILSGEPSDKIRQDTFTKAVGVWTNPLKRIVPTFYEEYLKQLVVEGKKAFPLLTFDACFGAFIFASENKDFSFFKGGLRIKSTRSFTLPKVSLPKKEIFLFIGSFVLSFLLFVLLSKVKLPNFGNKIAIKNNAPISPTAVIPSPSPSFKKEDLKIKVLNGGGVAGKATEVKEILTKKGYGDIITGNADNFDYVMTEVQIKKSFIQIGATLKTDLKDYLESFKQVELAGTSSADIVFIIGQDFK